MEVYNLIMTQPAAWPIGNHFLVLPDKSDEETEAGIILTVQQPKFTGTVAKLPYGVQGFDTIEGKPIMSGDMDVYGSGAVLREGSRIQWSSQTAFAIPVSIDMGDEGEIDYLLFTVRDVDLVLPDPDDVEV
jgi:hypothetical protein